MKVTKLEHATLVLEEDGKRLVVDPGSFTTPLSDVTNVVAVVVTHEHADHWTPEQLHRLLQANPGIPVYGPQGVADAAAGDPEITVVAPGDTVETSPFTLRFFGGQHAVIHSSIPVVDNVGVLVNDSLYYPGDSFVVPEGVEVDVLAAPSSAPWLKVGEAMDFVTAVSPRRAFAVHEMINSQAGKQMAVGRLTWAVEQGGGEYVDLQPGDSLEV